MVKVLIVGGTGFIGSNIARQFLDLGHEVILFDAFIQYVPSRKENFGEITRKRLEDIEGKVIIARGDARNLGEIQRAVLEYKPDIIIQLASMPISTISNIYTQEAIDCCIVAATNILEVIKDVGFVKRFVYTSSSMIYGDFQKELADEKHPTEPKEFYGGVKLAGEHIVKSFCRRYGIDYTIIRPSAVYGPMDINRRVVQIFVENAIDGKELILEGADQKLDFTYVKDAAKGFVLAALSENAKNEIFNITNGQARSLKELVEILKKYFPELKVVEKPSDKTRPTRGTLDISKARRLLGFEPDYHLEKGIEEYIEFVKKNRVHPLIINDN